MSDEELQDYVGKPVRVTLADGRIIAGTMHAQSHVGRGPIQYEIVSDPVREGGEKRRETIGDAQEVVQVDDASGDPAAAE